MAIGSAIVGGISGFLGSDKEIEAIEKAIESQEQLSREGLAQLEPYRQAGASTLGGLQAMVNDPTQSMQNIAQSQQFQNQLGLASENAMRYRSATGAGGGLQSSGTSNQLAFLAPQLQNQMYQQQLQNRMGLAGLGAGISTASNQSLQNLGVNQAGLMQGMGLAQGNQIRGVGQSIQGGIEDITSTVMAGYGGI